MDGRTDTLPATCVVVDADALAHNARQVLSLLKSPARLMAVVKCDAYGHGLAQAARVFVEAGASWLGVSSVGEGVALREAGIDAPVLAFMPPAEDECEALIAAGVTATVAQMDHILWLNEAGERVGSGRCPPLHRHRSGADALMTRPPRLWMPLRAWGMCASPASIPTTGRRVGGDAGLAGGLPLRGLGARVWQTCRRDEGA